MFLFESAKLLCRIIKIKKKEIRQGLQKRTTEKQKTCQEKYTIINVYALKYKIKNLHHTDIIYVSKICNI